MDEITLKALAKINLGLDVIRRREDGYHEVRMVMQTIHLYDRLDIVRSHEPGICNQAADKKRKTETDGVLDRDFCGLIKNTLPQTGRVDIKQYITIKWQALPSIINT